MFRVQTQILDLHYHNEEQAPAFQDRARRLYYGALISEMEAVMEKHDLRDSIFRIHKLELDLGEMDEENFDTEWVKRFREKFEEELEKRLRLIRTEKGTAEDSEIPLKKRQAEIFEHYLLHGSLPWNANDSKLTPQAMAEELLNQHPADLIHVLKKHGNNEKVVRRLVLQLSEKQIIRIIEAVQPTEAKFIVETVEKVDQTRRKEHFVKTDSVHFRSRLWELALRYVLEDRGSYFNTKEFVKAMLFGIAAHFNMERSQLVQQFYKAVLHLRKAISISPVLWRMLAEIHAETIEGQADAFPFAPNPLDAATEEAPWYEGIITPYTDDIGSYSADNLPFVVPPEGFAPKNKTGNNHPVKNNTETPDRFIPQNHNGKFSENGNTPEETNAPIPQESTDFHTPTDSGKQDENNSIPAHIGNSNTSKETPNIIPQEGAAPYTSTGLGQQDESTSTRMHSENGNPAEGIDTPNSTQSRYVDFHKSLGNDDYSSAANNSTPEHGNSRQPGAAKYGKEVDTHLLAFGLPPRGTTAPNTPGISNGQEGVERNPTTGKGSPSPEIPDLAHRMAQLDAANLTEILEHLLFDAVYAEALQNRFWQKGSDSHFRRQLVQNIRTVEQFEKIVTLIDATHAPYVVEFSKRLQADQEELQLFPTTAVQFRKDQYYVLLTVLLARRGSYFNKKSFVKQVLQQLAKQYGMAFGRLIAVLIGSVPKHLRGLAQLPEILQLLKDLGDDEIRVQKTQSTETDASFSVLLLERISQWIQHGSKPAEEPRWGKLNPMGFTQLWETLLAIPEIDETHLTEFLDKSVHMAYITATLPQNLYQKAVERFVPFHKQRLWVFFESLSTHLWEAGNTGALSTAEFGRLRRVWIWQHLIQTSGIRSSSETAWEDAFAFMAEKLGTAPNDWIEKVWPFIRQSFADVASLETTFRRWIKKRGISSPALSVSTAADEDSPEAWTRQFLQVWGNTPKHSEAFQKELQQLLTRLAKKGEAEVLKFLNRVFTTQTFAEFLYQQANAGLLTYLGSFPVQAYGYFLRAIVQDFRYLLRSLSITLPQAEEELTKAAIHAWFMGERNEKVYAELMLQRLADSKKSDYKTFKNILRQQALQQQTELRSKLLLHLSTGLSSAATAPAAAPKPVRPAGIPYGNKSEEQILDNIHIHNAGLVITWPFLGMYLKRLNLTENNAFVDEAAQHRAVHLVHSIGNPQPATEFDLVLAKLLCGLQPSDPVPADFVATDDEKALTESLIKGIIQQWTVVGSSSVETLRQTFFQRPGLLYQKASGWELHPETKTFDVLLDKLPWGLQIIKLPWMKISLFCKWK